MKFVFSYLVYGKVFLVLLDQFLLLGNRARIMLIDLKILFEPIRGLIDLEPTKTICHIMSYSTSVISNFSVISYSLAFDSRLSNGFFPFPFAC